MMRSLLTCFLVIAAVVALPRVRFPTPRLDGRIVGGYPIPIQYHSYQVSITVYYAHACGGSILNVNNILTGAHCVDGRYPDQFEIIYATNNPWGAEGRVTHVSSFTMHPEYQGWSTYNDYDVAVIHVDKPIKLGFKAQPVTLTTTPQNVNNLRTGTVTGWGQLSSGEGTPTQLHAVDVVEYTNEDCRSIYGSYITDRMICFAAPGKDSCHGDSGGPLVAITTKEQLGIVSFGVGCADPDYPRVYANVYTLRSWIEEHGGK
ncbi:hypothetical protein FQA39_LY18537 [Lamprigera yunnana]|nr:hypothetical protein FQA39_LY18537 [Lamprigera yunnana]